MRVRAHEIQVADHFVRRKRLVLVSLGHQMCRNKRRHEKPKGQPDSSHTLSFLKLAGLKLTRFPPANPRFLPARRRGPGIDVSARAIGPNRPRPEPKVTHVGVVLAARKFLGLLIGWSQDPGSRIGKRPGIKLR